MKERGFDSDPEQTTGQSPGTSRGANVTRLHRPAKTDKPDVDNLVTDFLQALSSYSSEAEDPEIVASGMPAQDAPDSKPPVLDLPKNPALPIGPIVTSEAKVLHMELDAELDRTLREIELRPKLGIVPAPVHEVAKAPTASRVACEIAPEPEARAPEPVQVPEISVAKAVVAPGAPPDEEIWTVVRPKTKTGRGTLRLPLTYPLYTPWARYRLVFGIAAVVVTAAICLAVYLFSPTKSVPTGTGSDGVSQSAAQTPGATSTPSGAAQRQAAQDKLPLKAGAPTVGPTKSVPAEAARVIAPPPAIKTPGPAARDENTRTNVVAPANVKAQSRGLEANAPDPVKQAAPPRNDVQGNYNAAAIPAQPPPPPSAPAVTKATEPPVAPPAKVNVEPPPVDAPKVSPPPPPAGGAAATTNPAETVDPKINTPAAKTEPVPLVTPAEPVFKVSPAYPLAAQKMRVTGTVEVRVSIDEQGKVTKAAAISGHNLLRFAAEDALRKWKFKPATLRGTSVKSELVISVSFVR